MEVTPKLLEHELIPKHELMSSEEAEEVLEKYDATRDQLPKIRRKDAAIKKLDAKVGDIIKITRESEHSGKSLYYRVVIEG